MRTIQPLSRNVGLFALAAIFLSSAGAQGYSSQAEAWAYRTSAEKTAYLLGFCDGVEGRQDSLISLGQLTCVKIGEKPKADLFRLCGAVPTDKRDRVIKWFDTFYSNANRSDIPFWAAAAAYNDQACNESVVTKDLASIQARAKCFRALSTTFESGVSKTLQDKLVEECKAK